MKALPQGLLDGGRFPQGAIDVRISMGVVQVQVHIDLHGNLQAPTVLVPSPTFAMFSALDWTPDEIKKVAGQVWSQNAPGTNCANAVPPQNDCNCYVKSTSHLFVSNLPFDDSNFTADQIIAELARSGSGWTVLGADPDAAMTRASAAEFVIAGMKSTELGEDHGHLAIVVDGFELSATWRRNFPRCYAGSLSPSARVANRGVQFTFPVRKVLNIQYFSRRPDLPVSLNLDGVTNGASLQATSPVAPS